MAVVDWRGFRLVAMSLLPIGGQSLVYGSSDGGVTVLAENPEFNELMKEAAKKLNIKVRRRKRRGGGRRGRGERKGREEGKGEGSEGGRGGRRRKEGEEGEEGRRG
jgi:hypothetical protein